MSMNPRLTTEKIKTDYRDYIASILSVKDEQITRLAYEEVKRTSFVKGPYLETTLPFVEGKSLKELAEEGLISKEFEKMGASVHYEDWHLRIHQENALRHIITEDRNMVVSTGTGSGKTECYLYPIFNELMRQKEAGELDAGVRALLIFPMNALANDQQKKLRKLLKTYPDITFGRYTRETQKAYESETIEEAEQRLHSEYESAHIDDSDIDLRKALPNELMSREAMAKNPPHLLLTNYAMLEYLLLRPDTAPFFDNDSAKNWKYIVIDEAHTYRGATGAEIALLLRRLKERICHNRNGEFRCIATSATLGNDENAAEGLAKFSSTLFGETFTKEDVITTVRIKRGLPQNGKKFSPEKYIELKHQTEEMGEDEKGVFLYNELVNDARIIDIYEALSGKPKRMEEVAEKVFSDISQKKIQEEALINLIELAAAAKKGEYEAALLPARYHLFVKSLEGMFVQYYPEKQVFLDRREKNYLNGKEYTVYEVANCQHCNQEYIVGRLLSDSNGTHIVQTSSTEKPDYFFISSKPDSYNYDLFDEDDLIEENEKFDKLEKYHLCLGCGRLTEYAEATPVNCCEHASANKIVTVYQLKYGGKTKESNCCPCCGSTKKGLIKRFLTANQPATMAVAKSLYDAIPPRPKKKVENEVACDDTWDDWFDDVEEESEIEIANVDESGRKLLIFSDNRQEAAFFAGFFEKKYSLYMWRRVILKCLREAGGDLSIDDLIIKVKKEANDSGLYTFDQDRQRMMSEEQKKILAAQYVMQEFMQPDIATGLEGMGYISIYPKLPSGNGRELAGFKGEDLIHVLRFMLDTLRQKGAISYPDNIEATDDFFSPRNHRNYFRKIEADTSNAGYTYGFIPKKNSANRRLSFLQKLQLLSGKTPEESEELSKKQLEELYNFIVGQMNKNGYLVTDSANGIRYTLNYKKWNIRYNEDDTVLYRCKKCGKVLHYNINNICHEMKCDGEVSVIKASEIKKTPYYGSLYSETQLIPMVAREHTAQLASKTAGQYQKYFEEGKINVLSCSTTFEMGVDVGELEATFQRNVPPETANYIQRAGRAGRRTSSAAFSVTYSRRNSHDMTFFNDPTEIIAGKIIAPVLKVDNEKIAQRHLNSVIISWFFKKAPEYFVGKTRKVVSYGDKDNMAVALKAALEEHPVDLLESIHTTFPQNITDILKVDEWQFISDLTGEEGALTKAIEERANDLNGLKECIEDAKAEEDYKRADDAYRLMKTLEEEPTISFLSAKGVLPKYGFPIDSVPLTILCRNQEEAKKIELSRDLKMAISEFAPPAEIVANGKVWKSYAINTIPDRSWPTYVYYECPECKRIYHPETSVTDINVNLKEVEKKICVSCGKELRAKKFIIPLFGFSTSMRDYPKLVGETRPKVYYGTKTQFWGVDELTQKQQEEVMTDVLTIEGKKIKITYSPGGKLFVLNQGKHNMGLNVCPTCGYTNDPLSKSKKHRNKYGKECKDRKLINVSLGHHFSTDILKIQFPTYIPSIENAHLMKTKDVYLSTVYALLEGASKALDISREDINGCVTGEDTLILYDDTPGGSGFVKQIYKNFIKVLNVAQSKVSGEVCGCTRETSCYGCLRNYSNQFYHDSLSRGLAYDYLEWILHGVQEQENDIIERKTTYPEEIIERERNAESSRVGTLTYEYMPAEYVRKGKTDIMLKELAEDMEEGIAKDVVLSLSALAHDDKYEDALLDVNIDLEQSLWPEVIWPKSHVALFSNETRSNYEFFKTYNWHCFILEDIVDPHQIFQYIKKVGE